MHLKEKLKSGEAVIGVVGLGYVGLPLVLAFTAKKLRCVGFDIDPEKVSMINAGESYIDHIDAKDMRFARDESLVEATTDFTRISEVDAVIMCVPTPLGKHMEPDLSYVTRTMDAVAPHLRRGQVVSLESTTYPGTSEEELRPRIESHGHRVGEDIYLVYSPEREDPGNPDFSSKNIPKVVGGSTAACAEVGVTLYEVAIESVVPVSSTKVAEMTKLLENIYRAVNIGLVNELKVAADSMGIDIWEVIQAASTKPFGFTPFYPGPGLGGHCIPIDPYYLTWKAREYGVHTKFIELAGEVNRAMPEYVIQRSIEALNAQSKPMKGSKVLVMGLAYKADVDDMRESPSFSLMHLYRGYGAQVSYYDPHIPVIGATREHKSWQGVNSVKWQREVVASYDLVVISTHHRDYDLEELVEWAPLIIDTRNALEGYSDFVRGGQVWKA